MIFIILGRATQFFLALLTIRMATTLLSPLEMGRVALLTTTTAFFAMFLVNPVGMFINRRLHTWRDVGTARAYLIFYFFYLIGVATCAALLLLVTGELGWLKIGIALDWLILLVCGSLLFGTINQTSIPSLNLLGDSKRFVLLSVATSLASFVFATLIVNVTRPEAKFWILGLLTGQIIIGLAATSTFFKRLKKFETGIQRNAIGKEHLRRIFAFSWPVSMAAGFAWVQAQGYRYLFDGDTGLSQLGMFVAGYGISMGMIAGFESILTTYFQPRLYAEVSAGDVKRQISAWQKYAASVLPSLVLTISLVISLAPELTKILLGANFQSAAEFVIWGALAEAARVLSGVYSLIAHVFMKTRKLVVPNFLGAASAIAISAVLIPLLGAKGAGIGLVVSGWVMVVALHLLLANQVDGGFPIKPIVLALIAAIAIWGLAIIARHQLPVDQWSAVIVVTGFVGFAYVTLQYYFLRHHVDKRK